MAGRPQHMHDGGIVERRLRPIYDWLDNGNNKKALQEAEKVLKKSPTLQAARALKALSLFRLGKSPEAHSVLEALAEEKPSDDTTLQAMTICYRECQQLQKVCSLYEAAVKVDPTSEELHSHLFMSYVRVGDYRAQQRAAMTLYKFAPKNPYYFWAVMSIVLQAKESDDVTKRGILLALAQRMVDNFISENKMEAEQEARLYIMILELQEKWEDILKFIESPLYDKLLPGAITQAVIPYLKKLKRWKPLNLLCKELLYDNPDRWDYYVPYFESVFHLMKESDKSDRCDDTAEKCHEFICQLVEGMGSGRVLRGPYLARLELWKRLAVDGNPTELLGSGVALCVQYLRVFANKPCAVPDLRPYLEMIPQDEREQHCRDFLTCLGFDEDSEPTTPDDIQRHISCLSLWRLTAAPLPAAACLSLAARLRAHYLRANSDGYAILAAHHYIYAAIELQSSEPVVEALCLLELVLHRSPANFHVKLLLITLYHLLGNALAADSIYQRLEVKHIQLISLGWLHCARLAGAAACARALQLLADTRAFRDHQQKDSVEHLTYAYKYGTFEKLVELGRWNSVLLGCAWGCLAARQRALLALLAGPPAPLHAPAVLPEEPVDNRDLSVIVSYDPPQCQDPDLRAKTFEEDLAYLRLKDGLVSSIALCIELADGRPVHEKKAHYEELTACVGAFSDAMAKCRDLYGGRRRWRVSEPFPSRIIAFVSSPVPYRELYSCALTLVGELATSHTARAHALAEEAARGVRAASPKLKTVVPREGWGMREAMEHLSVYLEFIGIITFLLGVCNELSTPTNTKKSKKKTNQSPDELRTSELLSDLNQSVQDSISDIEQIIEDWPKYTFNSTLEQELNKLSLDKYQCPVQNKLNSGLKDVLSDLGNILKKKVKYLKSLQ
ncbi:phagocyte signaling-impaired protein [Cydia pomonella]|uniref:phagocyte signaling-impaired protein n=1 Tax=Cydia pomonella TaxID=82600 RepID=UPI002ADDB065|nr:phagocyte signaling-impaired protein [Cydia pomonella]